MNANFAIIEQCLALAGGTLTGTLNSRDVLPVTDNTYVLGSLSKAWSGIVARSLKLTDTNQSHVLSVEAGSNLTANRTLTFTTGDVSRTVTIAADCTIGGVQSIALGGTGTSTAPGDGKLLIGKTDGSYAVANIAAGSNITVTNTDGGISIAATGVLGQIPIGSIFPYAGNSLPDANWGWCHGGTASRATYASLYALIGDTYGAGDGVTTFNLPNLVGRFPLGVAASGTGSALGATGGAIDHTHTAASGGAHTHTVAGVTVQTTGAHTHDVSGTTSSDGDHSHTVTTNTVSNLDPTGGTSVEEVGNATTSTDGAHTHTFSDTSTSNGDHTHTLGGNVDSDGAHTHTTDAANPPFLAIQFIIRLT